MLLPRRAARRTTIARTCLVGRLPIAVIVAIVSLLGAGRVGAQTLPAGWADQDIGAVGLAGSATYDRATFTVKGAGADIWGTADSFNFANQALPGDGQIIAHVASITNTSAYAKAGVMIRETLTASSPHVILDVKPGGGVEFMARPTAGGPTSFIAGGTGTWLKLVRSKGVFTASVSSNGSSWTVIGSKTMSMSTNVWVGLTVCSHNTGVLNTSVLDNVSVAAASEAAPTVTITSPVNGASFLAGASISISANASDTDATPVARVDFYANNGTANALVGSDTSSPYAATWSNAAAGSYSLTAVATDTANRSTTSAKVGISVASGGGGGTLPAGWADQDVGAVGLAGSASYGNGSFTVKGAGADIWGTADSFNFANQALAGDGQIIAHVASMTNTNAYAKAGVMIRETLTASSPHLVLDVKPGGAVEFMARATSGGPTSFIAGGAGTWLKLVRSNGVFTASSSSNGSTWTVIGSKAMSMAANVWVGLAVCSHNTSALNTSLFDSVTVMPLSASETMAITSPPIGTTFRPGSNIVVTVTGSGLLAPDLYVDDGTGMRIAPYQWFLDNSRPGTCSILWGNLVLGDYAVMARTLGGQVSNVIRVRVSTTSGSEVPPAVVGSALVSGTTLTLAATTSDPDATPVARVDYYDYDSVWGWFDPLGSATTSPYTVTWTGAFTNYFLAVVTDTAGIATATWFSR